MVREAIERQARYLAYENRMAEPEINRIYWFPNDEEVRLIELHPQVPLSPDGEVRPLYFRASPEDDLPAPSGVALIHPQEYGQARLPADWGTWNDAVELPEDE